MLTSQFHTVKRTLCGSQLTHATVPRLCVAWDTHTEDDSTQRFPSGAVETKGWSIWTFRADLSVCQTDSETQQHAGLWDSKTLGRGIEFVDIHGCGLNRFLAPRMQGDTGDMRYMPDMVAAQKYLEKHRIGQLMEVRCPLFSCIMNFFRC